MDPNLKAQMDALMSARPSAGAKPVLDHPVGPTRSNAATLDAGLPPSSYLDMPSREYWGRVASSIPGSAGRAVVDTAKALTVNLPETMTGVYNLGKGIASKGYGFLADQDPVQASRNEAVLDAMIDQYKGTYAGEPGSFWKKLAEDPAAIGMDVATVAGGVGALGKAGPLGRAGRLATNLDPTQAALNVAGNVLPRVGEVVPKGLAKVQSFVSGVPYEALMTVRDAFLSPDPARRYALRASMKNGVSAANLVDHLDTAISSLGDAASQQYMSDAANAFALSREVPMAAPVQSLQELTSLMNPSTYRQNIYHNPADIQLANTAVQSFLDLATNPNPGARTIKEIDVLKKELDRIAGAMSDPSLQGRVSALAKSLIQATEAVDPTYAKMMSDWADWKNELKNLKKEFGSTNLSDAQRASKIMKSFSNPYRLEALERLSRDSGVNLREIAAGSIVSPKMSDTTHTMLSSLGSGIAGALLGGSAPHIGLGVAGGLGLSSPRVGGASQAAMATAERSTGRAADLVRKYGLGPLQTNIASQIGEYQEEAPPRIERRAGGRVAVDHAKEAQSLIVAAERAKRAHNGSTEAILNSPDEHVVKALEVANRSI